MALGRDRWGTDNHHAAGSAVIAYLNRVTGPLISQYVLERLTSGIKKGTFFAPENAPPVPPNAPDPFHKGSHTQVPRFGRGLVQ